MDHRKSTGIPDKKLLLLRDYSKAIDCVDNNKLWKILKEMGIPEHLTCLFKNMYAGQEATVRIGHGTTDRFQIIKDLYPQIDSEVKVKEAISIPAWQLPHPGHWPEGPSEVLALASWQPGYLSSGEWKKLRLEQLTSPTPNRCG